MCDTCKACNNHAEGHEADTENLGGYESWMEVGMNVVCMLINWGVINSMLK